MSRMERCDENSSQIQLLLSLENNIRLTPNRLDQVPQYQLDVGPLEKRSAIFTPVSNDIASLNSNSPRTPISIDINDNYSSKNPNQAPLTSHKIEQVLQSSSSTEVGKNSLRHKYCSTDGNLISTHQQDKNSKPHESQIIQPLRSISDAMLTKPDASFDSSRLEPKTINSSEDCTQMARTTPRSYSNDSVLSYFTEKKRSKNSQDITFSTEIANLISTAGSAELVISFLLKEKKSQAAQNTQLWRLVDKQRAMILGLNKDLERALKDKERYRKKVKEYNIQLTSLKSGNSSEKLNLNSEIENDVIESSISAILDDMNSIEATGMNEFTLDSPSESSLAPDPIISKSKDLIHQRMTNADQIQNTIPTPLNQEQFSINPTNLDTSPGDEDQNNDDLASYVARTDGLSNDEDLVLKALTASKDTKRLGSSHQKASPAALNLGNESSHKTHISSALESWQLLKTSCDISLEQSDILESPRGRPLSRDEFQPRTTSITGTEGLMNSRTSRKLARQSLSESTYELRFLEGIKSIGKSPTKRSFRSSTTKLNAELPSKPVRTSLFSTSWVETSLPSSPRPLYTKSASSPNIRNLANYTNSPPASPLVSSSEASAFSLSQQNISQVRIPSLSRTPTSNGSIEELKQQTSNLTSPKSFEAMKNDHEKSDPNGEKLSAREHIGLPSDGIYKGFITEEYPELLLPPSALALVDVKVASSRMRPSRASLMFPKSVEEDPVFTLNIFSKSDKKELWRVEKDFLSLTQLDQTLKAYSNYDAKLPDRSLFSGHAPAKIDARRHALNNYLDAILKIQTNLSAAMNICKYLSSNAFGVNSDESTSMENSNNESEQHFSKESSGKPLKNGYLTKRGKNFGGWKARYFVLDGPVLHYFESPGGPCLGAIRLEQAQIGKQSQPTEKNSLPNNDSDDYDNKYRHAFLILESKKKDASNVTRHILCAESDVERDQWVDVLCKYMNNKELDEKSTSPKPKVKRNSSSEKFKSKVHSQKTRNSQDSKEVIFRGISYENTKPQKAESQRRKSTNAENSSPLENVQDQERSENSTRPPSPKNSSKYTSGILGTSGRSNKANVSRQLTDEKIRHRKRSFFGFGTKSKALIDSFDIGVASTSNSQSVTNQNNRTKNAFGASLADAVKYNSPLGVDVELPAVVYRCVEYLNAKNAFNEEGIFRLSGSNLVIKGLRERFNSVGDVNLLEDDQYHDIHAVASLLKLYLRELPSTILTTKLHTKFFAVTELHDTNERIDALNSLVCRLPSENRALIRYLVSFLIKIINNSDVNKMTVRNVGIVFSPTLNIPASIFSLFLQQFSRIFGMEPDLCLAHTTGSPSNSSKQLKTAQKPSALNEQDLSKLTNKLAGPTFNKSIGASKSYRQNNSGMSQPK